MDSLLPYLHFNQESLQIFATKSDIDENFSLSKNRTRQQRCCVFQLLSSKFTMESETVEDVRQAENLQNLLKRNRILLDNRSANANGKNMKNFNDDH